MSLLPYYADDDADRRNILRRLAYCHSMTGDFARACEHCEAVLASPRMTDAERADVRDGLERIDARRLYQAGRYAAAAQSFERVLERLSADDADWCGWLFWLAACYWEMGAHTAARDCYEEILRAPRATEREKTDARRSLDALKRRT